MNVLRLVTERLCADGSADGASVYSQESVMSGLSEEATGRSEARLRQLGDPLRLGSAPIRLAQSGGDVESRMALGRKMSVIKTDDDFFTRQAKRNAKRRTSSNIRDLTTWADVRGDGTVAAPPGGIIPLPTRVRQPSSRSRVARPSGRLSVHGPLASSADRVSPGNVIKPRKRPVTRRNSFSKTPNDSYKLVRLRMRAEYMSTNHPMYAYKRDQRTLAEATITGVTDPKFDCTSHVVVCRFIDSIEGFIMPLRMKVLKKRKAIVIVAPLPPDNITWERLANFEDVYYMQGDPSNFRDLKRAGVETASAVVVWDDCNAKHDWRFMDTTTLLTLRMVTQRCPNIPVLAKLLHSENLRLADPNNTGDDFDKYEAHELSSFASGQIFPDSMLGTFLYQAYYNEIGISVASVLLEHGSEFHLKPEFTSVLPRQSRLFVVPMPAEFAGGTYLAVYKHVVDKLKGIPLGLYRHKERAVSNTALEEEEMREEEFNYMDKYFVFTAPPPTTTVFVGDSIYFLANRVPNVLREAQLDWVGGGEPPLGSYRHDTWADEEARD